MRPLLALLCLAACDLGPKVTTTTITDEGTVCLNDAGQVEVTFPGCLSSSCDTLTSATCTAELDGELIVVHGEAVIDSEGEECTADCGIIQATCDLPDGADSATGFSYAGEETALDAECAVI